MNSQNGYGIMDNEKLKSLKLVCSIELPAQNHVIVLRIKIALYTWKPSYYLLTSFSKKIKYTGCPKKKYSGLCLNNFKAIEAITLK